MHYKQTILLQYFLLCHRYTDLVFYVNDYVSVHFYFTRIYFHSFISYDTFLLSNQCFKNSLLWL